MLLIVGSTGFIGENLKRYLHEKNISFKECNIRNSIPIRIDDDIETVLYLVGKAHDTKNKASIDVYNRVNVDLTLQFLNVFLESKANRFIYVSSIKAVCDKSSWAVTEEEPPQASSIYGISKFEAECQLSHRIIGSNKDLIILRPAMVYGPKNKGNLNALMNLVKYRIPYPFVGVKNKRSILSVNNFSFVIECILNKPDFRPGIYHLADNEPLSTVEIIEIIERVLKKRNIKFQIPALLFKIALRVSEKFNFTTIPEKVEKLTESFLISNNKIKKEIGSDFPVNSKDGLEESFKSLKIVN